MTQVKSSCFHKLRNIAKMKKFLTIKQVETLVHALVVSSLDYCNALYFGCHQFVINQLQTIQNRACRVIFGLKKRDTVNDKLQSLHWLKVKESIEFKLLIVVFKSLNGLATAYLSELICYNNISGSRAPSLQTSNQSAACNRSFQVAAPELWNDLPQQIRESQNLAIFKKLLKTHLFTKCYSLD